jgi:hypothetical protein
MMRVKRIQYNNTKNKYIHKNTYQIRYIPAHADAVEDLYIRNAHFNVVEPALHRVDHLALFLELSAETRVYLFLGLCIFFDFFFDFRSHEILWQ